MCRWRTFTYTYVQVKGFHLYICVGEDLSHIHEIDRVIPSLTKPIVCYVFFEPRPIVATIHTQLITV